MMFTQGDCMLVGRSKCRVGAHICIWNMQNPYDKLEVATKPGVTEDSLYIGRDILAHSSDGVEWAVRLIQV